MLNDLPERVMVLRLPELDAPQRSDADDQREDRDRLWAAALRAFEQLVPGIEPLREGWCAMRARGPARYYGSESAAASALAACAAESGFETVRIGIASGRFAAEQAAHSADSSSGAPEVRVIPSADTRAFLAPLPVGCAAGEDLVEVLTSLGIRTLGDLAALSESAVRERFGPDGTAAQRRALGLGAPHAPEVRPRPPEADPEVLVEFEPPLDDADQLAFACAAHAERLVRGLSDRGLVCTELRVDICDDADGQHERRWAHPARFSAADVINRIRWQAAALSNDVADPERTGLGVASIRLTPVRTARASEHEPGLWNTAPDDRVHHHLSRVQSLLGHRGVGTGLLTGGRLSADRQRLAPWGTRETAGRPRDGPWPGHLPGPAPNTVFAEPARVALFDRHGNRIHVNSGADGTIPRTLSAEPARLGLDSGLLPASICAWSSVWPVRERWWSRAQAENAPRYRLQVLLNNGDAWLLHYTPDRGWAAEARYS